MKFRASLKSFATNMSFNKDALYSAWSEQTGTNAAAHIWFAVCATEKPSRCKCYEKKFQSSEETTNDLNIGQMGEGKNRRESQRHSKSGVGRFPELQSKNISLAEQP